MPYYVILASDGNLVESFDEESEAHAALEAIARQDPESADEYAMIVYDDNGLPVSDALSAAELRAGDAVAG